MKRNLGLLANLGFFAMALLIVGKVWLGHTHTAVMAAVEGAVVHTHEVLREIDRVGAALDHAGDGRRALAASDDGAALSSAEDAVHARLDVLGRLTADDPGQVHRMTELRTAIERLLARPRGGAGAAAPAAFGPAGTAAGGDRRQDVERVLNAMARAEERSLDERRRESHEAYGLTFLLSMLSAGTALALLLAVYALMRRNLALRDAAAEAIRAERERFRVTLRSIGDAVIVTDHEGRISFMNEIARDLTGWDDEAIGKELPVVFRIVNEQSGEIIENPVERVLRENEVVGLANHTILVSRDGREVPIDDSGAPVRDDDGNVLGAVLAFRDITKRRQQEEERRRADEAKDEFLAMLAHELRSPLAAVRNAIAAADLEPGVRDRAIDIARRQTARLTRLVDDLLDVARITRRKIVLRKERVTLGNIVQRCVETARPFVEDRGQSLSITYPPEPIELEADPVRLEQTIDNLVTNAVKYTPGGGKIELVVERAGGEAVLRVRDNGSGMEPDLVPRVFDLFAQGRRTPARTDGGLGIGLTIVKLIVGLHGGSVEAHSDGPGKGSEFVVRLPALAPERETKPAPPPLMPAPRAGRPVLVVDDNADAAEALTMLLQLLGFETDVAHDGREALEILAARSFGLVFVDIGLPGIDGYEVARRLRDAPGRSDTQLVALTGYGRDEDRAKALEAGFDMHLVKPVELETLKPLLARLDPHGAASVPAENGASDGGTG